tara:strand:- start:15834 stop:16730 length:897 start_codon:yes stop_codon:yes gene_type:complete
MKNVLFLGIAGRSSSEVRGIQLSEKYENFHYCDIDKLTASLIDCFDIFIFIRKFDLNVAKRIKSSGKVVGYDLLDRVVADVHQEYKSKVNRWGVPQIYWDSYSVDFCDFMIVNNHLTKKMLKVDFPVFVIPHHHCNFDNETITINRKVNTVGYVGLSDQLSCLPKIENFLDSKNINFLMDHPTNRTSVVDLHKKIDIGLIFLENFGYFSEVMKYKPNNKLTNFQSFGIPTISCEYESFTEFGGKSYIRVDTLDDVYVALEKLICSYEDRKRLSVDGLKTSQKFSIDNIFKFYSFLENF